MFKRKPSERYVPDNRIIEESFPPADEKFDNYEQAIDSCGSSDKSLEPKAKVIFLKNKFLLYFLSIYYSPYGDQAIISISLRSKEIIYLQNVLASTHFCRSRIG